MKVSVMKLADLKRPEKNCRIHTDRQLKEFKRSVEMFGQIRPIVVDETNTILCGNGLYEALLEMGKTEASVLKRTDLTDAQKKIFRSVVKELEPAGTLCKLDADILVSYAVAKAALNDINAKIAEQPVCLTDREIISARRQYSSEYFRCLNELGLSPQSRAKMANMAAQAQAADPLLEALRSSPDEDTEERADSFDSVEADLTVEITDEFSGDDDE